jgi:hypothetical protein
MVVSKANKLRAYLEVQLRPELDEHARASAALGVRIGQVNALRLSPLLCCLFLSFLGAAAPIFFLCRDAPRFPFSPCRTVNHPEGQNGSRNADYYNQDRRPVDANTAIPRAGAAPSYR